MASVFDLITSTSELSSSNNGMSDMQYNQISATRDIANTAFSNGPIHYRWENGPTTWSLNDKHYFRLRCSLTKGDGVTPLDNASNIAPQANMAANLFQSMEGRVGEKTISRISDYSSQVDFLSKRSNNSKSWLDSIGASTNFMSPYFADRQSSVTIDGQKRPASSRPSVSKGREALGFDAAGVGVADGNAATLNGATGVVTFSQNGPADIRTIFTLGSFLIYRSIQGAGVTDARLNIPLRVIELLSATSVRVEGGVIGDVATDARMLFSRVTQEVLEIDSPARRMTEFEVVWQIPLSMMQVKSVPTGRYELILNPLNSSIIQKAAIESLLVDKVQDVDFKFNVLDMYLYLPTVTGPRVDSLTYYLDLSSVRCQSEDVTNSAYSTKQYDVSPSSTGLTVAFQDLRATNNSRFSQSKFKAYDAAGTTEVGQALNRFSINYNNINRPSPDADPLFTINKDWTTQRYIESQMANGGFGDAGGAETLQEWHENGSYYTFQWPKDGQNTSTRVQVSAGFTPGTDISQTRMLLFDTHKSVARITIQNSRVVEVLLQDS